MVETKQNRRNKLTIFYSNEGEGEKMKTNTLTFMLHDESNELTKKKTTKTKERKGS